MRKCTLALASLLLWPAASLAASSPPVPNATANPPAVQSALEGFLRALDRAIADKDRKALERLYAPEFVFIHGYGNRVDRAQQIAEIMASPATLGGGLQGFFDRDTQIIAEGNVAIVRKIQPARNGRPLWSTAIYVKRPVGWQLLQMQGTLLPFARQAIALPPEHLREIAGRYRQDNGNVALVSLEDGQFVDPVSGPTELAADTRRGRPLL